MTLTVFGISTCDSCKKARRWLEAADKRFDWVDLRESPPSLAQVTAWVGALGSKPLRNTSGRAYRELPEKKRSWSDARWITAFHGDPMLIKRPLLVRGTKAVAVGFQADRWAALEI